jgi:hypothetical protein
MEEGRETTKRQRNGSKQEHQLHSALIGIWLLVNDGEMTDVSSVLVFLSRFAC